VAKRTRGQWRPRVRLDRMLRPTRGRSAYVIKNKNENEKGKQQKNKFKLVVS
jgi:predicted RNA-binding protein YlxR (DUF448 family)